MSRNLSKPSCLKIGKDEALNFAPNIARTHFFGLSECHGYA